MNHHTYLATMVDGGGAVPAELGAVRRLVARGHRVVALGEESIRGEIEAAGATYLPWTQAPNRPSRRPEHDPYRDWECTNPRALFRRLMETQFAGPAAAYAADTSQAIREHRPDAVLSSVFALGAMIAAEAADVPYALPMPNIYPVPAPGYPAFGSGLRPPRTPLGRAVNAGLGTLLTRAFDQGLPQVNSVRADHGLPPLRHFWEQVQRADQMLLLTSPAFDFPLECPPGVRYVGPVLDDPSWADTWSPPPGDEPLVLVGMSSTYQEQQTSLQHVVDALGTLPVRGLVTTGPALDPASVSPRTHVTVVASAPHAEVLRHAAVSVNHGGHGSVIKALAAGVPMVVLPHGRDQKDNAVRVEACGAGISVRRDASPRRIAAAVRRVLDDPAYRRNARRVGEQVRRDAESGALVTALEELPRADRAVRAG